MPTGLTIAPARGEIVEYLPTPCVDLARDRYNAVVRYTQEQMVAGKDYGVIPGSDKPTLLKPGAEKLCSLFGLHVEDPVLVERVEDWIGRDHGEPFFYYLVMQRLTVGGRVIASQMGSCNSFESKYRWRWVPEADVPAHLDKTKLARRGGTISEFAFAVEKAETTGQYGKPAAYWQRFREAIANGTAKKGKRVTKGGKEMDCWLIGGEMCRVPNDDVCSLPNTIIKIAQKRALVAAALVGCNASEFYTQDLEELEVIQGGAEPPKAENEAKASNCRRPPPADGHPLDMPEPATPESEAVKRGMVNPKTGSDLLLWLGARDDEGADAGFWVRGSLLKHMTAAATTEEPPLPTDVSKWPDNIVPSALDVARAWIGMHARPSVDELDALETLLKDKGKAVEKALAWVQSEFGLPEPPTLQTLNVVQHRALWDATMGKAPKKKASAA